MLAIAAAMEEYMNIDIVFTGLAILTVSAALCNHMMWLRMAIKWMWKTCFAAGTVSEMSDAAECTLVPGLSETIAGVKAELQVKQFELERTLAEKNELGEHVERLELELQSAHARISDLQAQVSHSNATRVTQASKMDFPLEVVIATKMGDRFHTSPHCSGLARSIQCKKLPMCLTCAARADRTSSSTSRP